MRGFTLAMRTIQGSKDTTISMLLAQRLLDEYEINVPPVGHTDGHFGDDFPLYRWQREVWIDRPKYDDARVSVADNEFNDIIMIHLKVLRVAPNDEKQQEILIDLYTAATLFERFNATTRLRGGLYWYEGKKR